MDIIELAMIIAGVCIFIKYQFINPNRKQSKKRKRKKKYHDPRNNYFRNNPEHIDMTDKYIDDVWNKIK